MKNIVMLVGQDGFRAEELFHPKEVIEKEGFHVDVASRNEGIAKGYPDEAQVTIDITLNQIEVSNYDAIVFVGGKAAADYFEDEKALQLARDFAQPGKVLAAICIGPSTPANAGVLQEKKATSFPSQEENLKSKGAFYTGEPVTIDGNIITASGPQAAYDFGKAIVNALK